MMMLSIKSWQYNRLHGASNATFKMQVTENGERARVAISKTQLLIVIDL